MYAEKKHVLCIIYFRIVSNLYDASGTKTVLHVSFRRYFDKIDFNSKVSEYWLENQHVQGVDITAGSVAKLKVGVFGDTFKVCLHLSNARAQRALICIYLNTCAHAHY
jgi:hypothetical protein